MEIDFYTHWRCASPEEKEALAKKMMTSTSYLSRLANGHHAPGKFLREFAATALGVDRVIFRGDDEAA